MLTQQPHQLESSPNSLTELDTILTATDTSNWHPVKIENMLHSMESAISLSGTRSQMSDVIWIAIDHQSVGLINYLAQFRPNKSDVVPTALVQAIKTNNPKLLDAMNNMTSGLFNSEPVIVNALIANADKTLKFLLKMPNFKIDFLTLNTLRSINRTDDKCFKLFWDTVLALPDGEKALNVYTQGYLPTANPKRLEYVYNLIEDPTKDNNDIPMSILRYYENNDKKNYDKFQKIFVANKAIVAVALKNNQNELLPDVMKKIFLRK